MGALILFQTLMLFWVAQPTANDAYTRALACACFAVELVATCLILASNIISSDAADDDLEKIEFSLNLAGISAQLLVWACFVPMFFTGYDSFIVPIVQIYWKSEVSANACAYTRVRALFTGPHAHVHLRAPIRAPIWSRDGPLRFELLVSTSCTDRWDGLRQHVR